MAFVIEKYAVLTRKKRTTEGTDLSNQDIIRTLTVKKHYKYWRILEADTTTQTEI